MNKSIAVFPVLLFVVQLTLGLSFPQAAVTGARAAPEILAGDEPSAVYGNSAAALAGQVGRVCGDLTGDEVVDVSDIVIMLRIAFGLAEPTPEQEEDGDLNHDHNVDVFDATIGFQHIVGLTEITDCGPVVLTIGNVAGAPGEQVTVQLSLNTKGLPVRSVLVHLDYDPTRLSSPVGEGGSDLPGTWTFDSASPASGELRLLAFDLGTDQTIGQRIDGVIFTATFTIQSSAPPGEVPVAVAHREVYVPGWVGALNLDVVDGAVTIE